MEGSFVRCDYEQSLTQEIGVQPFFPWEVWGMAAKLAVYLYSLYNSMVQSLALEKEKKVEIKADGPKSPVFPNSSLHLLQPSSFFVIIFHWA